MVIAVVGVLIGSLVTLINPVTQLRRARDATRKSSLSQIRAALELYRSDVGNYRAQSAPFANPTTGAIGCGVSLETGSGINKKIYMLQVPCDPLNPASTYFYSATGGAPSTYTMWVCLEDVNDRDRDCADNSGECDRCAATGRVSYTVRNP